MKVALLAAAILLLLIGGGIWVATSLSARLQAKLDADQALVDGPVRPPPPALTSADPPEAEPEEPTTPPEPPTIPPAAVQIRTIDLPWLQTRTVAGFAIDPGDESARVVTCSHLLHNRLLLGIVVADERTLPPLLVGGEPTRGMAQLWVDAPDLPRLTIADQQPEQESPVWVVGSRNEMTAATVGESSIADDDVEIVVIAVTDAPAGEASGTPQDGPIPAGAAVVDREGKVWGIVRGPINGEPGHLAVVLLRRE